jgi:hypothetical protein
VGVPLPAVHEPSIERCARCGDRIGVYEPLCWERADGSRATSSLAAMDRRGDRPPHDARVFHLACAAPARPLRAAAP